MNHPKENKLKKTKKKFKEREKTLHSFAKKKKKLNSG